METFAPSLLGKEVAWYKILPVILLGVIGFLFDK